MQIEFDAVVRGMFVNAVAVFYNGDLDEVTLEIPRRTRNGIKYRRAAWLERAMSKADEEALADAAYEAKAEAF